MICPKCGKEMEKGKLASQEGKGLFFMPPDKFVLGTWVREKTIVKEGGIVLDGPYNFGAQNMAYPEIAACVCRDCRVILVEY